MYTPPPPLHKKKKKKKKKKKEAKCKLFVHLKAISQRKIEGDYTNTIYQQCKGLRVF